MKKYHKKPEHAVIPQNEPTIMVPERKLVGGILPAVPDIVTIVDAVQAQYPELRQIAGGDQGLIDAIVSDANIDWDAIRLEVESRVRAAANLIPERFAKMYIALKDNRSEPPEVEGRDDIPSDIRETYVNAYKLLVNLFKPLETTIDQYLEIVAQRVMEFLMTGRSREIPEGWLAAVFAGNILGEKTVTAMAGSLSDPKEVAAAFKRKYTETFGRSRPNITNENIHTVEYLTWRLNGMKLRDVADIYMQRHAGAYPSDPLSKAYKAARGQVTAMLKMRMVRLEETIARMAER